MRCPDCNKFVSYEEQDPEVTLDVDQDNGVVTAEVRIVNECAECGTELADAELSLESDSKEDEIEAHQTDNPDCIEGVDVEEINSERITRTEGKGRWTKTFYGAQIEFSINCSHCNNTIATGNISDYEQASAFNDLT